MGVLRVGRVRTRDALDQRLLNCGRTPTARYTSTSSRRLCRGRSCYRVFLAESDELRLTRLSPLSESVGLPNAGRLPRRRRLPRFQSPSDRYSVKWCVCEHVAIAVAVVSCEAHCPLLSKVWSSGVLWLPNAGDPNLVTLIMGIYSESSTIQRSG